MKWVRKRTRCPSVWTCVCLFLHLFIRVSVVLMYCADTAGDRGHGYIFIDNFVSMLMAPCISYLCCLARIKLSEELNGEASSKSNDVLLCALKFHHESTTCRCFMSSSHSSRVFSLLLPFFIQSFTAFLIFAPFCRMASPGQ